MIMLMRAKLARSPRSTSRVRHTLSAVGEARSDSPISGSPAGTHPTVDVSPEPAANGASLAVIGKVTKVGVALPAATVKIRFTKAGSRRFTTIGTATTDATGRYTTTFTAVTTGTWKAIHPATAATLTSSDTDGVRVRP